MGFHEVHREGFIPGRDRGVGGENGGAAGHFVGGLEVEALDFGQELQPGEAEKGGMALVEVADIGFQPHCDEGAEATDGEEEFLADPVFMSPTVKPGGDFEEFRRVFGDIGVQQNQGDAADLEIPDAGMQFALGEHDADLHQLTICFPGPFHGKVLDFRVRVDFLLPAILIEALFEVPLVIKQANANEGHRQIGGGFQVVAGQNAEAPGGEADVFVEAEFQGKISDQTMFGVRVRSGAFLKPALEFGQLFEESRVFRHRFKGGLRDFAQESERILSGMAPCRRINAAEKIQGVLIPAPPGIPGQYFQKSEGFRNARRDVDDLDVVHGEAGSVRQRKGSIKCREAAGLPHQVFRSR